MTQLLPPKKEVALALLERSNVDVYLDPRSKGVVVPPQFRREPRLIRKIGLNMPVPIPDLHLDEESMACTLSFNRSPFYCIVPWSTVFAMVGEDGRGMVWPDDVPHELASKVDQDAGAPGSGAGDAPVGPRRVPDRSDREVASRPGKAKAGKAAVKEPAGTAGAEEKPRGRKKKKKEEERPRPVLVALPSIRDDRRDDRRDDARDDVGSKADARVDSSRPRGKSASKNEGAEAESAAGADRAAVAAEPAPDSSPSSPSSASPSSEPSPSSVPSPSRRGGAMAGDNAAERPAFSTGSGAGPRGVPVRGPVRPKRELPPYLRVVK